MDETHRRLATEVEIAQDEVKATRQALEIALREKAKHRRRSIVLAGYALLATGMAVTLMFFIRWPFGGDNVIFPAAGPPDFPSFKRLPWGSVAHTLPREMRHSESRIVEILVSPTHSVDELESMLSSDAQGRSLQVTPMMTATLVGQGFQIEPSTPPVQAVAKDSPTRWQWTIKPKPGAYDVQLLTLSLWARVQVQGSDTDREVRTFNQLIQVKITRLERTAGFVGEHWEWFATPMLGFVGWWGRRRLFPSPRPRSRNEEA